MRDWWVLSSRDMVRDGDRVFSDGKWKKISNYLKNPFFNLIGYPAGGDKAICRPKDKFHLFGKVVCASTIPKNGFFRKLKGEYVYKRIGFERKQDILLDDNKVYGVSASGCIADVKRNSKVMACTIKDFFDVYNYKMTTIELDGSEESDYIANRIKLAGE